MKKNASIALAAAVVVGVLLAAVLGYAKLRPNDFRVQRTVLIKAPPEKIYPLLTDFHRWSEWSPDEKRDPEMKRSFGGARIGSGAMYQWQGNRKAGEGRMIILKATPSSDVMVQLDLMKPIEGHNLAEFKLVPQGDATAVTWSIHGWTPYVGKLMGVFVNIEKRIGNDFDAGLADLKAIAER